MAHKGLTAASMHVLACAVVERGGLDKLILTLNDIGDAGAEALAPAVPLIREASLFWQHPVITTSAYVVEQSGTTDATTPATDRGARLRHRSSRH